MRARAVCLALILFAGACGQGGEPAQPVAQQVPPWTSPPTSSAPDIARPPAIHVRGGGKELALSPWTTCWQSGSVSGCADGRPPEVPQDIGSPPEIEVSFEAPGWKFSATAVPTGETCGGRRQSIDLPATGATTYRLLPIGRAGDYTMTLNGRSTDTATNKGDVVTTFRWRTTKDGPNEPPSATMSLTATPPGVKVDMGAELSARALGVSTNAGTVEASAVVTTSTGATLAVDFKPSNVECRPDGSFFLRSPNDDGKAIGAAGPPPYRYAVTLTLNGKTYRGTGTWPQDEIHDCSPCTRLRWDPPLPAL